MIDFASPTVREAIRDAVRFWEPMRALYNVILVLIIVPVYVETWPESLETLTPIRLALGVICAVFANIAYCAAYVPDFILQAGGFHDSRWYWRSAIFVTGTLFAAAFAFVFAIAPFLPQ